VVAVSKKFGAQFTYKRSLIFFDTMPTGNCKIH